MNLPIKKLIVGLGVLGASLGAAPGDAHAWLKFKNSSTTQISVAHAFDSRNEAFCGWPDFCTFTDDLNRFRVQYWWVLAPGAESTVQSEDFENALHEFYAFGADGSEWAGGGHTFRITLNKGTHCGWTSDRSVPSFDRVFAKLNTSRCCGAISCAGGDPANRRVQLTN